MSTIRNATLDDLDALVKLGRVMHAESPRFSRFAFSAPKLAQQLCGLIVSNDGFLMVAENGGQIVGGFAGFVSEQWFSEERSAHDLALFVQPDRRGGLVAVKLVKAFVEWAAAKGVKETVLGISTGVKLEDTAALYAALGLKRFGYLFEV